MDKITEAQTITNIHLSDTQKVVLTKIIASATPTTAHEAISDGRNLVEARNLLAKLGLIQFDQGTAAVTPEGEEVMRDENLIDEMGQLTPDGEQYSQVEDPNDLRDEKQGVAPPDAGAPEQPVGGEQDVDLELDIGESVNSLNLIREIAVMEATVRNVRRLNNLPRFTPQEVEMLKQSYQEGNDLSYDMMDKLYEFVVAFDPMWMPYGTQKARDGDPHEWIYDNLPDIIRIIQNR